MYDIDARVDVSVVIVNYNTERLVLDCIDSIWEKTEYVREKIEVIVVDNASPQRPVKLPALPKVRYIQSPDNIGFGRGNNLGASVARGKYLFFLNSDTILVNDAISILYQYMEANPQIGICGGNLYNKDMSPAHSFEILPPSISSELFVLFASAHKSRGANVDFNRTAEPMPVAVVIGADMFVRAQLFNEIGGFDKDFFMYFEETYLCYKVESKGYGIMSVPQAQIIHLNGQSTLFMGERNEVFLRSKKTYLTKRYGIFYYYICISINAITCISRIAAFGVVMDKQKVKWWWAILKSLFTF